MMTLSISSDPISPDPGLPNAEICYRALKARDPRFDGRFFVAVRSTGIYCRPICPARTPKRENCRFMPSAAAAQAAGYRSCLRCRPETAPGTPAWAGVSASVARALRLIDQGALDDAGVEALAARLGLGARHLRRLFLAHVGVTPQAVAANRRLLLAKQLISDTDLAMNDVAFAAGYRSLRRFNDAVRCAYGRPPTALRRGRAPVMHECGMDFVLRLGYRPPFAWGAILDYLGGRAIPEVECVTDNTYRRSFRLDGVPGLLEVRDEPDKNTLCVRIISRTSLPIREIVARVRRMFDLDADPQAIADLLGQDPAMAARLARQPGLRIPGGFDGFELGIRAILGQQISVKGATTLAGRLAARAGQALDPTLAPDADGWPTILFPTPAGLADADLIQLGLIGARAATLCRFAAAVRDGMVTLTPMASLDAAIEALTHLDGIGPWTANYIALRAIGEPDAFPAGDLGLQKAAGNGDRLTQKALEQLAEKWRPWRGYAALYLWTDGGDTT